MILDSLERLRYFCTTAWDSGTWDYVERAGAKRPGIRCHVEYILGKALCERLDRRCGCSGGVLAFTPLLNPAWSKLYIASVRSERMRFSFLVLLVPNVLFNHRGFGL